MSNELRSALYTAAPSIGAVLVVFGIVTEDQAAVLVAAVLNIAAVVVAFRHRPTKAA